MLQRKNIILFLIALIVTSCATVVPPNGGPIDTTPPYPVKMKPDNYSRNFTKKKAIIEFDEFIILDKLTQQLVVSPEMPEKPNINIRGKKLMISLPDSLSENTTYTIFFGNAIVNFKENIPIANFEYVFSTGNEVDSMMIEGNAVNAFDHKVSEGSFVMLYKEFDDSIPYHKRPYYLTKVENNGHFRLSNLHAGNYKIFALQDMNSNYLFDQPTEEIAFIDSIITPYPDPRSYIAKDSTDTLEIPSHQDIDLYFFTEAVKKQNILESKLLASNKFQIIFAKPITSLGLNPLNLKKDTIWNYNKFSKNQDSLTTWLMGVRQDTLLVEVSDNDIVLDTLRFVLHKRKRSTNIRNNRKKKKKKEVEKPKPKKIPRLAFSDNARGGFPFYSDIHINFKTPIREWDPTKIKILRQRDTIIDTLDTRAYFADTNYQMHLVIPTKFKEYKKYGLFVDDSTFYDLYGHTHDTISKMFVTTEMREYGSLALNITYPEKTPLIVQLLDAKDVVVFETVIQKSGKIDYPYLKPGKYRLKAIEDSNNNGKWDTGDYINKLQPERVFFVNQLIGIRANWDVSQDWIIE